MALPLLTSRFFQAGYAVLDLDRGVEMMKSKGGIRNWQVTHYPKGGLITGLATAWTNGVMMELVGLDPDTCPPLYQGHLPATDSEARLHHFGYMYDTLEEFRERIRQSQADGFAEAFYLEFDDVYVYFADTYATLGHYCELIHLGPGGQDFFAHVPHN